MVSLWSQWILIGADRALFTSARMIGHRSPAAMYRISAIKIRPWEEVAVMTRAPAAEAPIQALIAECSLSTVINSVSAKPSAIYPEKICTISVAGVIG